MNSIVIKLVEVSCFLYFGAIQVRVNTANSQNAWWNFYAVELFLLAWMWLC